VIEKERGLIKSIHKRSCNIYFNKICVAWILGQSRKSWS
jgi:hypothetical protein